MIRLASVIVRIYGERGARMEQRDPEVSAIGLPALAALTTGLRSSISKAVRSLQHGRINSQPLSNDLIAT